LSVDDSVGGTSIVGVQLAVDQVAGVGNIGVTALNELKGVGGLNNMELAKFRRSVEVRSIPKAFHCGRMRLFSVAASDIW
jgi:hypothetical protein